MAVLTNAAVSRQSMVMPLRCDSTPAAELATMITSEVPIAIDISTPSMITRAGMMRNPPPTPNSPVSSPTANPAGMDRGAHRRQLMPESPTVQAVPVSAFSCSIRMPATTITTAKPISSAFCGRCRPTAAPTKVAGMPAAEKMPASRHCTCPARTLGTAPTAEASPMTIRDIGIATSMSTLRMYTSAGTARIDPPPPSKPSSAPMKDPSSRAVTTAIRHPLVYRRTRTTWDNSACFGRRAGLPVGFPGPRGTPGYRAGTTRCRAGSRESPTPDGTQGAK
jgi:hypothetical protein